MTPAPATPRFMQDLCSDIFRRIAGGVRNWDDALVLLGIARDPEVQDDTRRQAFDSYNTIVNQAACMAIAATLLAVIDDALSGAEPERMREILLADGIPEATRTRAAWALRWVTQPVCHHA